MLKKVSSPVLRQYATVLTVNLCVIPMGMGMGWSSPVLVILATDSQTILPHPVTVDEASWIVAAGLLAAPFVTFFSGFLVDWIGRKNCVLISGIPKIISPVLFIFASDVWIIIFGQVVSTIGDVFLITVVPMYASEIASKEIRGSLGTIMHTMSSFGMLMMLSVGPFLSYITLNIFLTIITLVVFIPVLFLPDSPYFLYAKARTADAVKVLTFLRASEKEANEEIKEYDPCNNKDEVVDRIQLFKNRVFVKTFLLGIIMGGVGQLTGYNAVIYYLQTVLESTGTNVSDEVASAVIGCIQFIGGVFTALVLSDRFGRKSILITTFCGMSLGMISLGVFFYVRGTSGVVIGFMNVLPLISLAVTAFCFSAGYLSMYWMVIAEIFDGSGRGVGVCASVFTYLCTSFLTSKYLSVLTSSIGPSATYWAFGVVCILFSLFIWFFIPETKGKTIAEIQKALGANTSGLETQDSDIEKVK